MSINRLIYFGFGFFEYKQSSLFLDVWPENCPAPKATDCVWVCTMKLSMCGYHMGIIMHGNFLYLYAHLQGRITLMELWNLVGYCILSISWWLFINFSKLSNRNYSTAYLFCLSCEIMALCSWKLVLFAYISDHLWNTI